MKPLYGNGGAAIFRIPPGDTNLNSLIELMGMTFREPIMVQRYIPEVRKGDKRIILVDGEFAGAINRVPAPDETRSNLHVGGTAKPTTLTKRDKEICARLGPELQEARADLHRHRRDRRLSHRDQRHLADRHQADRRVRRTRHRRHDLGRDREEGQGAEGKRRADDSDTATDQGLGAMFDAHTRRPSSKRATSRRPWRRWAMRRM